MLRFRPAAMSHRGLVRQNNEDSGYAGPALLLVADGVGGHAAGEVASASVAHVMAAFALRAERDQNPAALLEEAVRYAFAHLRHGVAAEPDRTGMATTLTAVLAHQNGCALAHVGDSRAYRLSGGTLRQITRDDTYVQELIDAGKISRIDVVSHPYRSVVVRSVTAESRPVASIVPLELNPGDRLLLCSDGLTDFVSEDTVAHALSDGSPTVAARSLVDLALEAGGGDNVTCVVADVCEGDPHIRAGTLVGAHQNPANLIDPVAAVAQGTV
ncbi:PP2C family protein-serine/threonine phosphatase [Phytoactinopolyspora mesophila]|uniref:SpoIIE family protein phosphatase n=1 Tax=Phytoactinopolyspora mesophila TaxID=2650750 RepID=A0A7K3LZG3_9ACTN|nr:protein phosphatase 2C domain-containing protein [Phytoactinopolyspora mesophila]NDL56421.1 SpoIIE family protein phosphatase [Phytoactinopolyspora mesophila]